MSTVNIPSAPTGKRTVVRPTGPAVAGTLLAALVFVVVLDFLVLISFLGNRVWETPELFRDSWFTLPIYVWFVIVGLAAIAVARIVGQRIVVSDQGLRVRGLFRWPRTIPWSDVTGLWVVRDIYRGRNPRDPVETDLDAAEALIVMATPMRRIANVSGRFFGRPAQGMLIKEAESRGIRVERLDHARPSELSHMLPGSQTFADRHPNLLVLAVLLVYVAHNVLTFMVWGL